MNLLLSNDDGIYAAGIRTLAQELKNHYNITIVAPDSQRSGASHSLTCIKPVRVRKITLPELPDIPAYAVDGTPADCVRIGCTSLDIPVDIVVSGINHGANLGSDVLYSGTVGAAMEGALIGKPAIAVSSYPLQPIDFTAASRAALWTIDYMLKNPLPKGMILNLNAPELPISEIKGIRLAGLALQKYEELHAQFEDPHGARYFWAPLGKITEPSKSDYTDERWVQEGYITLTPIHYDIACYSYMENMDVSGFNLSELYLHKQENKNEQGSVHYGAE